MPSRAPPLAKEFRMQRDCETAIQTSARSAGGRHGYYTLSCLALVLGACQGTIGDGAGPDGKGPPTGSSPGGPPGAPGAPGAPAACLGKVDASVLHARMLSPRQYDNTVADLLKVGGRPARDFGGGA